VLSWKKKILLAFGLLIVLVIGVAGYGVFTLTRPLPFDFSQNPNAVEAHEADRKLKLLNEAQADRRQGFIRLSEVEINSLLESRYNSGKNSRTNDPVKLVKSGVLLEASHITFITWHNAPVLGVNLPLVWQRVLTPSKQTNGWNFALHSMRVGNLEIPPQYWKQVEQVLGGNDSVFADRKDWLRKLPLVSVAHNEENKAAEIRLYTYLPKEKTQDSEEVSE
jgi:hypothetical protein